MIVIHISINKHGSIMYISPLFVEKELGSPCSDDYQCKDSNAKCSSHICNCSANHFNNNDSTCLL